MFFKGANPVNCPDLYDALLTALRICQWLRSWDDTTPRSSFVGEGTRSAGADSRGQ